ncbi:NAD(P)H-binding protein [Tahibacter caeni]|uniref:NAD(P)H-binding protein n=1 Tax=Tahibacter caeni TaxID=1453545 RepID=UPI002149352E|nr:NAD(P)H-binding protein [Tahibacter caeni]
MQTILGANGQIAVELARELQRNQTRELRLVNRNPRKVNDSDVVVAADLLDAGQTARAVEGSSIVYLTAGLPPDTEMWEKQFPTMPKNALDASWAAGAKFAYFDNTYMYSQDDRLLREETPFAPVGRKGRVRARTTTLVLEEVAHRSFTAQARPRASPMLSSPTN